LTKMSTAPKCGDDLLASRLDASKVGNVQDEMMRALA
jgi:hypothetical protein